MIRCENMAARGEIFRVNICQYRQNDSQSEEINVIGESPADREQARACAGS